MCAVGEVWAWVVCERKALFAFPGDLVFFQVPWTDKGENSCPHQWLHAGIMEQSLDDSDAGIPSQYLNVQLALHASLWCIRTNCAFSPTTDLILKMFKVTSVLNMRTF